MKLQVKSTRISCLAPVLCLFGGRSARGCFPCLGRGDVLRAYDGSGNQITLTNRRGKGWVFQFDGANGLTNTLTPLLRQTKQVWNNRGLLESVTDPRQQPASFLYDGRGRLTNATDQAGVETYGYDANNNLTSLTETSNSQPSTLNYSYDAYDRMSAFTNADGCVMQYRYDASGNLTNSV